ncbi:TBC1 domain family member 31 [Cydia pomonella]|uniref:TBC1 domain family member 31 n=1 Tax=Cydia pomonella TaxID=82600 RepID=UPI002ADE8DA0|nr:TBC1 domain family member 31 [Cydia pomonella]
MEFEQHDGSGHVQKYDIKLKTKPKDGVILQLHHTVRNPNGENRRIRFSTGVFDDSQEKLACSDTVGNLFILDFSELKFWKFTHIGPCTALHFIPNKTDELVVTNTKKCDISFLSVETGKISFTLTGHTAPVKHISFSNNKLNNLLTASPVEAILWELTHYTKYFTLNTYLGAQIQQILFTPAGDYLVACFQNDTVQIWKHESMKSVKQIIPTDLKNMRNIAFTMNGRAMAMAGISPTLILFSMDTWKALKSIDLTKYGISGAQHISFIPQVFDGGANKILAILGSDCALRLLDLESLTILQTVSPESSGIRKFVVSPTGKYFLCILKLGEVNIYNSSYVMDQPQLPQASPNTEPLLQSKPIYKEQAKVTMRAEVEQKMRVCMDSARLRRILMQYGEYPDKFRPVIWRSLLETPTNKVAYSALIEKGNHPSYKDIEKQFTIHSSITLKNLKRLLSCLAHWCPLFGVMKCLPAFVFPFVKVLQKDPLLLFECVATILLNHCQLWFEYAPFPPLSILAMIENVLGDHDPQLLKHYCDVGITSQVYALKILETAFSEVLTCTEWLILWDHILSNEPAFILMAVVSYNIVQKNAIKKLKTHQQLENFFHMQNPIDKKTFLKKAYMLLNDTRDDIHPRRFFNSFVPLDKGVCYQQFTGYPKATICLKLAKKERDKIKKPENLTLKDLTTRTQEKEIKNRFESTSESKITRSDDDDDTGELFTSPKYVGKHAKKKQTCLNRGDRKLFKERHATYLVPKIELKNKLKSTAKDKGLCKRSSKCKGKKTDDELEKVVEMLFRSGTESDT